MATPSGERAIGSLKVGDQVTSYDPSTGKSSTQTVQHVWVNHDHDLLDVTLHADRQNGQATEASSTDKTQQVATTAHGSQAPPSPRDASDETIHTTEKHPWLTTDRGWVTAGKLHVGEHVVELNGHTATITALVVHPGAATYYNLTVSQLHTYAVGDGQYVVHNVGEGCIGDKLPTWTKGKPTEGYLDTGAGDPTYIRSGSGGPADRMPEGTPGYIRSNPALKAPGSVTVTHVEAHAAAIMREGGLSDATLWINKVPCGGGVGDVGCNDLLPHMLPEGATLTVNYKLPGGSWGTSIYTGLPDSQWPTWFAGNWPP